MGEGLIVEVPHHLSWSQANSLVGSYCAGQYWLGRVLGKEEIPSWASIGGSAVHKATEDWDHILLTEGNADQDVARLFQSALDAEIHQVEEHSSFPRSEWKASGRASKDWPDKENQKWWEYHGPGFVQAWVNWQLSNSWEIATLLDNDGVQHLGIEIPFEVELGGVPVRGYIDRVFWRRTPDGGVEYLAVDLKSGSMEPKTAGQLATYKWGLFDQWGVDAKFGAYWMARTGLSGTLVDMDLWPRARVEYIYSSARRMQEQALFPYQPSNMCGGCALRAYCPEYGGEKAASTPQPWDVTEVRVAEPHGVSRA